MKQKRIAAALAFFLGIFGVHRFYLGQKVLGIIHFVIFFIGMAAAIDGEDFPIIAIPALIGFVDAVVFAAMPREDFDEKYNRKRLYGTAPPARSGGSRRSQKPVSQNRGTGDMLQRYKRSGIEKFRDYDYEGAAEDFENALEINFEAPSLHFNLACCYSILEEVDKAAFHLEKAVAFGFEDFSKIRNHDALAYLRTTEEYEILAANDFRRTASLPEANPVEDLLSSTPVAVENQKSDDLLEQIKRLGELRDKGILTNEEFTLQKRKILEES